MDSDTPPTHVYVVISHTKSADEPDFTLHGAYQLVEQANNRAKHVLLSAFGEQAKDGLSVSWSLESLEASSAMSYNKDGCLTMQPRTGISTPAIYGEGGKQYDATSQIPCQLSVRVEKQQFYHSRPETESKTCSIPSPTSFGASIKVNGNAKASASLKRPADDVRADSSEPAAKRTSTQLIEETAIGNLGSQKCDAFSRAITLYEVKVIKQTPDRDDDDNWHEEVESQLVFLQWEEAIKQFQRDYEEFAGDCFDEYCEDGLEYGQLLSCEGGDFEAPLRGSKGGTRKEHQDTGSINNPISLE
ncbi:hypothetical protein BJ508DRAFT_335102 [Ascobolus immersus RN42]|uniref:Uncharacterized protein n=1 Tax=Ascobolus immersus RN42 TaxID=1160509 RepID=A0A3N4HH62_ASCIM|nr:hypothetical protein BJ508DRAFT_335102 [Ascobolus immersus RN42]